MFRATLLLSTMFCWLAASPALQAQQYTKDEFRVEFSKAVEFGDEKMMDRAMRKDLGPQHACLYFEELYVEKWSGQGAGDAKREAERDQKLQALKASWTRCLEGSQTLDKVQRWIDGMDNATYARLQAGRSSSAKVWNHATTIMQGQVKGEYQSTMQQLMQLARNAEQFGHAVEAAEVWGMASFVGSKMPDKTIEDREEILFVTDQFLLQRTAWGFTGDSLYIKSHEWSKVEKVRIAEAKNAAGKREAAGYDANAKGIDSLVMPGVAAAKGMLTFEALKEWDEELDYGPKNGPSPALWWNNSLGGEGSSVRLDWFRRTALFLVRTGANKFVAAADPADPQNGHELDVSNKGKPTTFWLDPTKKQAYAMFFWAGSDRERVGEAECNMSFTTQIANLYYRSAASWKTTLGGDALTFFDDNTSGVPADGDPFEQAFKVHTLGEHSGDGTVVPVMDSMRIGKGPRVPFSEFVKLSSGWHHLHREANDEVAVRPLNPEYFKTGKIKLVWAGPKPSAPAQLVIQGSGDYKTAFFDIAGGKEVEVPAGEYAVIFGRFVAGKGSRTQTAALYRGSSATFVVEPGATLPLKMGGPLELQFTHTGDEKVKIDALSIMLKESSGCVISEFHNGISLVPEVFASKSDDGKGARSIGKFVRFTDSELLNEAAKKHDKLGLLCATFPMPAGYRSGELVLEVELPSAGMKLGLRVKKHPLFGALESVWK